MEDVWHKDKIFVKYLEKIGLCWHCEDSRDLKKCNTLLHASEELCYSEDLPCVSWIPIDKDFEFKEYDGADGLFIKDPVFEFDFVPDK